MCFGMEMARKAWWSKMDWSGLSSAEGARAARDEKKVRAGFWDKLKRNASYIPFAEDATAAYYAAFDKETPLRVRATLLAALAYFILPFDFAPDLIPILGFSDDAAILMGALKLLSGHVRPQHYEAARDALASLRQAKGAAEPGDGAEAKAG